MTDEMIPHRPDIF